MICILLSMKLRTCTKCGGEKKKFVALLIEKLMDKWLNNGQLGLPGHLTVNRSEAV